VGRGRLIEGALRDVVDLRVAAQEATSKRQRERIEGVARRRRSELGMSVPKTRAADVLGVSVTTLDKWIERGALPVVRRRDSARSELETGAVLELAVEVAHLREGGQRRGVLAGAVQRLEQRRDAMGTPGYFPDQARERKADFETLTAAERVAQAISLSRTATRIAAAVARASH